MGSILQVSVSAGGVPKRSVASAFASVAGLSGDSCRRSHIHGGRNQAVLLIASEILDHLKTRGFPVFPGALGENITTIDSSPSGWRIGQIWKVGLARIQFTKVRVPCSTIKIYGEWIGREIFDKQAKAGDPNSPVWCWGGIYGSVLTEGRIAVGDTLILESEMA